MKMNNLIICSVLVCALLATNVQAHFKMNGMNNITGAMARNGGQFSTATDGCGGATTWGTGGYTLLWPGQPLNLTWEMNSHPALPDFRIAYSPDGSESALFDSANYLVTGITHNGQGVYNHETNAPRHTCDQCTIQAWHTGYNWGGCFDVKIVQAPCSGKCGSTGIVENGKLNYNTGEISCNSGYTLNSKGECTKSGGGMSPAGAFFLSIFVILVVCILAFAILAVLRRRGVLPPAVANVVEKGENATSKAYHGAKNGISSLINKRKNGGTSAGASTSAPAQSTPVPTPVPTATPSHATPPPQFAKGMQVQARYSGDNNFYKAVVKDVNPVTRQVLVSYPEYNNEQEWVPESAVRK